MLLPNTPPKWTADWFPEEFKVRKYIFDTRRQVCKSYGFEEYLWPLVENADIWRAKSGEDVGWSELTRITDREGTISDLALRPEMTPSVTRMVTRIWKECEKPVKWFSIANFYRNEKPQKGRNREFWQLNADLFGENSLNADIEILSLTLDIMRAFNPPSWSYELRLNHRELINTFFSTILWLQDDELKKNLMRLLDKYEKLRKDDFEKLVNELWEIDITKIHQFMQAQSISDLENAFPLLSNIPFFQDFKIIFSSLQTNFGDVVKFSASLIRGFDYYDGIIFEMFDTNPENSRSLFGWGRYNGLAGIFGVKEPISAIGFAPGDETMKIFLENWGLTKAIIESKEEMIYIPLLEENLFSDIQSIASKLRNWWKQVLVGLSVKKLWKALQYADKKWFSFLIIFWEVEKKGGFYIEKNLKTGEEIQRKI
jgi:histidyl-tRNA synthetase